MDGEDHVSIEDLPELREPVILAAFAGWNDAAQVATHALSILAQSWSAALIAEVDPEPFYDFTVRRPIISLSATGQRSLAWPANQFFAHNLIENERDVVLLIGIEPHMHWKAFCKAILHVANRVDASCLVTLGGLLADVPHTAEPRLTGFATSPELLPQLQQLGVRMSSYEGPTGIMGALHDAWRSTSLPAISLWGNVPHYISAAPNPQISLALLQRVARLLSVSLPLSGLEAQAQAFRSQIDEALQDNPQAREYVQQLEQQLAGEAPPETAPELINELEQFLRSRRPPSDEKPGS